MNNAGTASGKGAKMQNILFSEWYGSRACAERAAAVLRRMGYDTKVSYEMRADGSHDWRCAAVEA